MGCCSTDDGSYSLLSPRSPAPLTPRNGMLSPPRQYETPDAVQIFLVCDSPANGHYPLSICFAVSDKYLLSNQHFLQGNLRTSYCIAKYANKGANGEYTFPQGFRPVKVRCFSEKMNYSLLELQDGRHDLVPLESLSLDDMLDAMMDQDQEDVPEAESSEVRDIDPSEFRIKMRQLSFL
jgi:hypothetical protein